MAFLGRLRGMLVSLEEVEQHYIKRRRKGTERNDGETKGRVRLRKRMTVEVKEM